MNNDVPYLSIGGKIEDLLGAAIEFSTEIIPRSITLLGGYTIMEIPLSQSFQASMEIRKISNSPKQIQADK